MKTIRQGRRHGRLASAFTLIELIVVILILGILAALIVPKVTGRTSDAKIARAKSDLSTLSTALTHFRVDCDRYPTTQEGLDALSTAPSGVSGWKGPYLTQAIANDPWGTPYQYEFNGNDSFTVESYGSDKTQGGEGDAQDLTDGSQ